MTTATLMMGRDGMGSESTEADFDAWVAYVSERIDEACGLTVDVETRGARDVQDDAVTGCEDDAREAIAAAVQGLWDAFCADTSAWPAQA